jgi:hypothetical protein
MKFEPPFEKYLGIFLTTHRTMGKDTVVYLTHKKIEKQRKFGTEAYESEYTIAFIFYFNDPDIFTTDEIFDFENENTNVGQKSEWHEMTSSEINLITKKMVEALFENRWKEHL